MMYFSIENTIKKQQHNPTVGWFLWTDFGLFHLFSKKSLCSGARRGDLQMNLLWSHAEKRRFWLIHARGSLMAMGSSPAEERDCSRCPPLTAAPRDLCSGVWRCPVLCAATRAHRLPTGCPPCGASSLSCRSSRGAVSLRSAGGTVVSVTWDPRPQPARACVSPCTGPTRCCCARARVLSVGHVTWVRSARVCVCVRAVTFSAWSGGEAFHQSHYSRATRLCTLPPSWHSSAFCV